MATLRHIAHKYLPKTVVQFIQNRNKQKRRKHIEKQAKLGGLNAEQLENILLNIGLKKGDAVLVHASLSRMGYVEGGAETVVRSIIKVVGDTGHVLMPTSSNDGQQLDFIRQNPIFDVRNTPSKMGAISEYFRKLPGVKRSLHPTESVACLGAETEDFLRGHFGALTPYRPDSPFGKLIARKGKILMIGVTLDNAGTNVHCLEDAEDFPFPIYYPEVFTARVVDYDNVMHEVKTKVHNPDLSAKRYCDFLIPIFEQEGVLIKHRIGDAPCLLIDAHGMFESLKNQLRQGRTIYGKTSHK
jgi:aminoglycoside 3-N-acetyltransferase